jgi:hypothetical protein
MWLQNLANFSESSLLYCSFHDTTTGIGSMKSAVVVCVHGCQAGMVNGDGLNFLCHVIHFFYLN